MLHDSMGVDLAKSAEKAGFSRFLIGAIATWRITEILLDEDAPFELASHLRTQVRARASHHILFKEMSKAFNCVWCLSVWVGWIVAILQLDKRWFLTGFAYSAIAIFVHMSKWRLSHGKSNN